MGVILFGIYIVFNTGEYYEKSISALKAIRLAQSHEKSISENLPTLEDLIGRAAEIKAGVVERDQFENGERRKLNLGHTFAHAIEWKARENEDDITHGEAVAMGIILAANMSEKFYGTRRLADKLREDFQSAGLPVDCPYPIEALISAMCYDKKAEGGKIHFVLMAGVGDVRIEECAPEEASDMIIH